MGITAEFDLQLYTRRLHAQRLQYGSESFWDDVVGTHAIDHWNNVAAGVIGIYDALDDAQLPKQHFAIQFQHIHDWLVPTGKARRAISAK
ncbi:hypothetical protein [Paraburkholderia ferrariae]|uniref:Uncharacterized protein n=1 Tax=Paraburkholderia ferrariae TaxID=386056 RepID=A0ABU9S2A6_9BURK